MDEDDITELHTAFVDGQANALARRHDLDAGRVRVAFHRLLDVGWLAPRFPWNTALDEAFEFLSPEDALGLFEEADLGDLARRVALVGYLAHEFTPLYTLDELADLARAFVAHLKRNKDHLLLTGHPKTSFARSPFLDWHLTRVCFTKLPLTLQEGRDPFRQTAAEKRGEAERDERGNVVYSYTWAEEPAEALGGRVRTDFGDGGAIICLPDYSWHLGHPTTLRGDPIHVCSYEDAALAPGLHTEDAARLQGMRQKLLELRTAVLRRLSDAAAEQSESDPECECLTLLGEALSYDDAQFLLSMDEYYEGLHGGKEFAWSPMRQTAFHSSGLGDLFEIVGHFSKEMAVGTMHRTALKLGAALRDAPVCSYYEVVVHDGRADIDAALEEFLHLEETEKAFLSDYRGRVNDALQSRFGERVYVERMVERGRGRLYQPLATSFIDFLRAHDKATGKLPEFVFSSASETPTATGNLFRRDGATWMVTFEGITQSLLDSKGMRYIAFLLEHQGEEFHVLELAQQVDGAPPPDTRYLRMTAEQLEAEGIPVADRTSQREITGDKYRTETEQKVRELQAMRDLAEARGDEDAASAAQDEIDGYLSALAAGIGRGRRHREFADEGERARQRVQKAVYGSLRSIKKHLPKLHAHLKASMLPLGYTVRYRPASPVDWSF